MSETKRTIHTPGWLSDFQKFIMRGNVLDLAIGVVIGAAFSAIVSSAVKDILTPFIGLLTGGVDFSNIFITLKGPVKDTLAEAQKAGAVTLNIGVFLNAVFQFLIVAFFIFWLTRILSKLHRKEDAVPAAPPAPTKEEILLTEIRDLLAGKASS
ncbi:large-conductance mechanosensitive channel protein MscL [Gluconobacter wancherniae]|uniref:Large-conductance mechanosensitive channel n=1 Tax=Gluconobacter wancherniae NBRC 103581 TaxID=656744 RepID=A0A511B1I7_9PROT|nr:large-conductance mechanosensitive channel protein MscL [Gluconobacter wancherniae]MBF0853505.1 large-conductance mechanosensitive channel protein MscL [Gluconobacter wancherniae]MBS1063257.1 large-conductance mechanosensitive channel protein MscL [Gluconobacter wancherniae]MBS1088325.1 large-conductance mechanosensitive channel protein MscL [Gluconobacter wancherniae]MBS1094010.1 large-conductance mechanosensitive channel protein MscL [Gluconobacter wancherniae]GBD55752.1 large-conductance